MPKRKTEKNASKTPSQFADDSEEEKPKKPKLDEWNPEESVKLKVPTPRTPAPPTRQKRAAAVTATQQIHETEAPKQKKVNCDFVKNGCIEALHVGNLIFVLDDFEEMYELPVWPAHVTSIEKRGVTTIVGYERFGKHKSKIGTIRVRLPLKVPTKLVFPSKQPSEEPTNLGLASKEPWMEEHRLALEVFKSSPHILPIYHGTLKEDIQRFSEQTGLVSSFTRALELSKKFAKNHRAGNAIAVPSNSCIVVHESLPESVESSYVTLEPKSTRKSVPKTVKKASDPKESKRRSKITPPNSDDDSVLIDPALLSQSSNLRLSQASNVPTSQSSVSNLSVKLSQTFPPKTSKLKEREMENERILASKLASKPEERTIWQMVEDDGQDYRTVVLPDEHQIDLSENESDCLTADGDGVLVLRGNCYHPALVVECTSCLQGDGKLDLDKHDYKVKLWDEKEIQVVRTHIITQFEPQFNTVKVIFYLVANCA
jgi:hypothetical protein